MSVSYQSVIRRIVGLERKIVLFYCHYFIFCDGEDSVGFGTADGDAAGESAEGG